MAVPAREALKAGAGREIGLVQSVAYPCYDADFQRSFADHSDLGG